MFKEQGALLFLSLSYGLVLAVDICEYQLNGAYLSHPADCNKFVECRDGKTERIMSCPVGQHFNRFTGICDSRQSAVCDMAFVYSGSKYATRSACCALYGCDNNPEIFETIDSPAPSNAGAIDTPTPETPVLPAISENPDKSSFYASRCSNKLNVCVSKSDGSVLRVDGTCNQYIICVAECARIMSCPANFHYNIDARRCDYPRNVNCPWQLRAQITGPSGVTCANQGKCDGQKDGKMFANSDGNGYIVCQCECEIQRPCPDGTKFNEQLLTCAHEGGNGNGNGSGNGNGNGNGGGNGGENGNGGGNGCGNGNGGGCSCGCGCGCGNGCGCGSSCGNGNGTESGGGNGNGTEGGGGNGNGTESGGGNGNGTESGGGNGNGTESGGGNGNGTESGGGNGNGTESGGGNGNGTESGGSNGGGSENGSGNNNSTNNVCGNNIQVCKNQTSGALLPVDGVCNKFYQCNHGCAVEIQCPSNTVFNPNKNRCDYPENYNCPWPHSPPSGPAAGPSGITCPSGGRCTGEGNGKLFPSLTSCSKYVQCQCECEIEMSCPKSLYWDSKLLTCNDPTNVKCHISQK